MAKKTVLELVQYILSSLDLDNVNSISDPEGTQISLILERSYEAILARKHWKFMNRTMNLEQVGALSKPTKLQIPTTVNRVTNLRHKSFNESDQIQWRDLKYMFPADFLAHVQTTRNPEDTNVVTTTNDDNVEMFIINNKPPEFWTSFDDEFIYLDNWDASRSDTVLNQNTSVNVVLEPRWEHVDSFVPDLPQDMFSALLNEALSIAWVEFKQETNAKAEQIARRQYIIMRENEPRVEEDRVFVNYAKSRGRSRRNSRRQEDIRRPSVR